MVSRLPQSLLIPSDPRIVPELCYFSRGEGHDDTASTSSVCSRKLPPPGLRHAVEVRRQAFPDSSKDRQPLLADRLEGNPLGGVRPKDREQAIAGILPRLAKDCRLRAPENLAGWTSDTPCPPFLPGSLGDRYPPPTAEGRLEHSSDKDDPPRTFRLAPKPNADALLVSVGRLPTPGR